MIPILVGPTGNPQSMFILYTPSMEVQPTLRSRNVFALEFYDGLKSSARMSLILVHLTWM